MKTLWVWGAGELGGRVAARWKKLGGEVVPLTKSTTRHGALRSMGVHPRTGSPDPLTDDDLLLISIAGTSALGDAISEIERLRAELLATRDMLATRNKRLRELENLKARAQLE